MLKWALSMAVLLSSPAWADGDELWPVAAAPLVGKAYAGHGASSEIEFVNTRRAPVELYWIAFDGASRLYTTIPPGGEIVQQTFVSHRWIVARKDGGTPIEAFISTRADIHGDGQPQIAIIR